jgi:heat-inducible transcriptional repressor
VQRIRNYIHRNFSRMVALRNRPPRAGRAAGARRRATYDAVLQKLTVLYSKGLLDMDCPPEVRMDGASNLVVLEPASHERKNCGSCSCAPGREEAVLELLDRFLEIPREQVGVHVGWGAFHPSMRELSS